jgi:phosphoribosylformylglycinamidine synthase
MIYNSFFENSKELEATPIMSKLAPQVYRKLHQAIQDGLVNASHDLSEGGLALAAAEMSLAGRLGLNIDLTELHPVPKVALFAETNGCLLVSVSEENKSKVEEYFSDLPIQYLGQVTRDHDFKITHNNECIIDLPIQKLVSAFHNQLESK